MTCIEIPVNILAGLAATAVTIAIIVVTTVLCLRKMKTDTRDGP